MIHFCKPFSLASLALTSLAFVPAHAQQLPPPAASGPVASPTPRLVEPKRATKSAPSYQVLPSPAQDNVIGEGNARDDSGVVIISPDVPAYEMPPRPRPAKPAAKKPAKVAPRVTRVLVHGIDVSRLSDAAALSKLHQMLSPTLQTPVRLRDGAQEYTLSREALGVSIPYRALLKTARARQAMGQSVDVPLRYTVDARQAQATLQSLARNINRAPKSISLDTSSEGLELAVIGSAQRVKQVLESDPTATRVEIIVKRTAPTSRNAVAESTFPEYPYLLANFSTPYDARLRGRTNNLRMAAKLVNGTVVPAGGIFSANRAIGPRSAAAGWREAKMFVDGQVVDGVGAGICQCSTTIYNAALLAGLPIVERHPHSFRVTYAPASRDAAIYWGSKDFRFRNNTGGPIYVQTFVRGGRFHARLFGTQPAPGNIRVESRIIARGKGTRSEAYRVRETSTGTLRERLSRDYYKPKPN
jgi:vancomycin resistance protein YoaR